eukprot:1156603-Pelagomonas_calceolata.AAC.2
MLLCAGTLSARPVQRQQQQQSLNISTLCSSLSARPVEGQQQQSLELPLCVGVGLVRGVDMAQEELFVLTPTPMEQLEQVRVQQAQGATRQGVSRGRGCHMVKVVYRQGVPKRNSQMKQRETHGGEQRNAAKGGAQRHAEERNAK